MKISVKDKLNQVLHIKKALKKLDTHFVEGCNTKDTILREINNKHREHTFEVKVKLKSLYDETQNLIDRIHEKASTLNVKMLTYFDYIRQEISEDIELAREDGESTLIIDGTLPDVITKELIAKNNVTIRVNYKFYIFPETIIYLKDERKN